MVLATAGSAGARTLYWRSLDVEATLDADGRLHVVERQTMVFDGAWNGGERVFRIGVGQKIEFHGMRRIDSETGRSIEMRSGSLQAVDDYDWHDSTTLRWRSRRPNDPQFYDQELIYELDYTLSGVIRKRRSEYWLDHDFAFTDRDGFIESFRLVFEIDDAWRIRSLRGADLESDSGGPIQVEHDRLPPGVGVPLVLFLERATEDRPAAVTKLLSIGARRGFVVATLVALAFLLLEFVRFESGRGRYSAPEVPEQIDRAWIEETLLPVRPEVLGAAWDQRVGPPEVAALLARLVGEGRLASSVRTEGRWFKKKILELELRVDRDSFSGYEQRLINKLFSRNQRRVDTKELRKRYRSSGFNPAASIRRGIERQRKKLPGLSDRPQKLTAARTLALVGAAFFCLLVETPLRGLPTSGSILFFAFFTLLPGVALGYPFASRYSKRVEPLWPPAIGALVGLGLTGWAMLSPAWGSYSLVIRELEHASLAGWSALGLFFLALVNSVLNMARTRESSEAVAFRKKLSTVRRWFKDQLSDPEPQLEDDWLPYLLAFGLEKRVDHWFRAFGPASGSPASGSFRSGSTAGLSRTGGSSWTGGGGAFGGAGATGTWVAAATGMAAGVAAPSSGGSSGGGGGGGGGSSGGGGGGGW